MRNIIWTAMDGGIFLITGSIKKLLNNSSKKIFNKVIPKLDK